MSELEEAAKALCNWAENATLYMGANCGSEQCAELTAAELNLAIARCRAALTTADKCSECERWQRRVKLLEFRMALVRDLAR